MTDPGLDVATSPQSDKDTPLSSLPEKEIENPELTESLAKVDKVLQSDIGVATLLTRLKQSISSAKDFATFLRKRAILEDEHAQGLKKLARAMHDSSMRQDNRQGSFARSYNEMNMIHDRVADHGVLFSQSLLQMAEELNDLAASMERGRKQWKQNGLTAEKRVQDAEMLAEKAKAKYDSLAEQYDRARTGERQAGKFGLKGPKSAAQQEEDLLRKLQQADSDYSTKVQAAQTQRQELVATLRPQATRALQDLIMECDSGCTLQLQKFASFNEKLLLGSGLAVSPMRTGNSTPDSLRETAKRVDNERDFRDFIIGQSGKVPETKPTLKYERHATLMPASNPNAHPKRQSLSLNANPTPPPQPAAQVFNTMSPIPRDSAPGAQGSPLSMQQRRDSWASQPPFPTSTPQYSNPASMQPTYPQQHSYQPPPQLAQHAQPRPSISDVPPNAHPELPPLNPVFGLTLDELFKRDGTAIPMVVYQCIQAVELFGLNVEGIYRLSGNANHIAHMKSLFDNDSSQVDFTNPESFYHDVNSVAGLLKLFFRDLPDPLFTNERYSAFIEAARKDDDIQRRDALHALINSLPDPNYATLRALILHLNHVQERSSENRMNAGNIAISFGLTLMGSNAGRSIADSGWQARVIETILQNTFQIFDDD
ncbi:Rho GTPase-activating protein [Microsporum canis]|uniref:Beta-chimaerin n=1 Tax=Arthroderma otae (strain ATCC MYA-4605 / CBS 113480) TaxID=554155 RepID=C5FZG4_ARTOC|nr:beta-chimaerin [Microsporum canis CBS 113480]EEQ35267.1 beta-chimaerin [Microsporum canis CBS 113480]